MSSGYRTLCFNDLDVTTCKASYGDRSKKNVVNAKWRLIDPRNLRWNFAQTKHYGELRVRDSRHQRQESRIYDEELGQRVLHFSFKSFLG